MPKNALNITVRPSASVFQINQVQAREAVSDLYQIEVDVLAHQPLGDLSRKPFGFAIEQGGNVVRYVHGMVSKVNDYKLTLRPRLFLLSQEFKDRIFYEKDIRAIVSEVLSSFRGVQCVWKLSKPPKKYEYKVQYRESTLNFLLRLLSDAGVLFYFIHKSDSHQVVFTDSVDNLPRCDFGGNKFENTRTTLLGRCEKTVTQSKNLEFISGCRDRAQVVKKSQWQVEAPLKIQSQIHLWSAKSASDFLPTSFELSFSGEQKARVIGFSQNSTYVNNQTSIKIQFLWQSRKQSVWVLLSHYWAGENHGVQFIPQVGDMVRVGFLQGNPDYPVVLGVVKDQANKKIFGINSEKHHLIFDHEVSSPAINISSQGAQEFVVDGSLDKTINQGVEINIEGNQSTKILNQDMSIEAKAIQFEVGSSQLLIDAAGIHLKASHINLKTGGAGKPIARKGDYQKCTKKYAGVVPHEGGPILSGSDDVMINHKPVARVSDEVKCKESKNKITSGIESILVNGKPVAHVGSKTEDGGEVKKGSGNVSGS